MKVSTFFFLLVLVVCCLTCVFAVGAKKKSPKDLMREACNTCSNIGINGGAATYICAKDKVKDCNMNIDGYCCSAKRQHKSCKSCKRFDEETFEDDEM